MTTARPETERDSEAVRCSAWARSAGIDPVGSAGSYAGFVLVDAPLPWPRDVSEMEALGPVSAWASAAGYRLQATVPDPDRSGSLIVHAAAAAPGGTPEGGWFAGYRRVAAAEGAAYREDLAGTLERLVSEAAQPSPEPEVAGRDVLVCTHGRRDVCCGSSGTELALTLVAEASPAVTGPGVSLRRTSHTGGHRFAPTFIVLPEGTAWAFADPDLVAAVVGRSVEFDRVAAHYRGCTGLAGPRLQALEREVLRRRGWDLLDRPRRGVPAGPESPTVRFEVAATGGDPAEAWEAEVVPGRTLPVPDCMQPLSAARKTETEWVVSGLRRI